MVERAPRRPRRHSLINPYAVQETTGSMAAMTAAGAVLAGAAGLVVLGAGPASADAWDDADARSGGGDSLVSGPDDVDWSGTTGGSGGWTSSSAWDAGTSAPAEPSFAGSLLDPAVDEQWSAPVDAAAVGPVGSEDTDRVVHVEGLVPPDATDPTAEQSTRVDPVEELISDTDVTDALVAGPIRPDVLADGALGATGPLLTVAHDAALRPAVPDRAPSDGVVAAADRRAVDADGTATAIGQDPSDDLVGPGDDADRATTAPPTTGRASVASCADGGSSGSVDGEDCAVPTPHQPTGGDPTGTTAADHPAEPGARASDALSPPGIFASEVGGPPDDSARAPGPTGGGVPSSSAEQAAPVSGDGSSGVGDGQPSSAPAEFLSGSVEDLANGLATGRYTFGERIGGGFEANAYALDGPLQNLAIRLKRINEDGPVNQVVDQQYYDVADRLLLERMQSDLDALNALGQAGLSTPDPRLVQWRYPETGAMQAGIVMDRLEGAAFRVPDHFGAADSVPPDVVYTPADPGPDLINESTLSGLLCARDAVIGCGIGWEELQGMLTPSGAYFLDPGVVLPREGGEWGRELADDTLATPDRLIADVQRRLAAAEPSADTPSSIFDPGDSARNIMEARSSRASVVAAPPEITPPETIDPWKVPVMAGLTTPEGQRLHEALVNATATITSEADWLDFVALAGDNLRNIALATDPLTEAQIGELYAPLPLEGLNAVARLYAEIDNEQAPFYADRLRTDQRYGFRSPEMEVTLVERRNEDGTSTASVWNRELQVGGTGSIQSARSDSMDLDCVTRICDIHTHPLSFRGSNAGLSARHSGNPDGGDLDALQGRTERIRAAGSDAEYSVASENLLDNTITMATNRPGETVTEFRVLSPGDLPIPDQIVLGPFTIDTVDLDPDIPTYPAGSTAAFFERMREIDDAGRAREQARAVRDQELLAEFDARLGATAPSTGGTTGSTDPSGEPPTGPVVSAPSAPASVATPRPRTAPLLPAVPSAGGDERGTDPREATGGQAAPDTTERTGSSLGGPIVGGDLGRPVSPEEAIEAMFPSGNPRRVDPPVVAEESLTPPTQERAEFDPNSINQPGEPVVVPEPLGTPTRDPVLDAVLYPNGPAGPRYTFPAGADRVGAEEPSPALQPAGGSVAQQPVAQKPVAQKPVVQQPVVQQPESSGVGATVRQWATDFVTGPWTMTRSEDGSTYRAAWGPPWSASVGEYDAATGALIRTEQGTPAARVNTAQYMDPQTGLAVAAAAVAPTLAARLLPAAGGGSLAGAGGLRTALPAAVPALSAVAPALPQLPEPVQNTWNRVTEGAGRLWDSVNGSPNRPTTPTTLTSPPSPTSPSTTAGNGSGGGNQLRVGDGTPRGAAAANEYNERVLGIGTNFVGNAQPTRTTSTSPSSSGSGPGSGRAGAGTGADTDAVARVPVVTSSSGSSGSSDWGASARQAVAEQVRPVIEQARPAIQQAQQTATWAQEAGTDAYRGLGDQVDAAADAAQRNPVIGGAVGWLRNNVPGLRGDGDPNR